MKVAALLLSTLGALTGFDPAALAHQQNTPTEQEIRIIIANGQNGKNLLSNESAVQPIVEILDGRNHPVAGARVTFTAPNTPPTVRFPGGEHVLGTVSDLKGTASVRNMTPVGVGPFRIEVTAEYDEEMTTAQISQTNYGTVSKSGVPSNSEISGHQGLSRGAKLGIVIGAVAVAAAAGLAVGLRNGSKKSGTSIGVGTPTVGAP